MLGEMKYHLLPIVSVFLTALTALMPTRADEELPDRSQAPHFVIDSGEAGSDSFPLRSTKAEVQIAGVIADVTVTQVYANKGSSTIEARYLFPASTRAAVHGMEMKIGDRQVKAEIQERSQAKQTYEKAKAERKSAALLEQQRPNVFEMSVANILPGDVVEVTLHYSEILSPEEGVYEFVYPTVVGPRYSNSNREWVENPYLTEDSAPPPTGFDFHLKMNAGMPIKSLSCVSHKTDIKYEGKETASLTLSGNEAGNRDVIVRYRLADEKITSGLLVHEDGQENFFLLNVQPPARVLPENIPPREYIFVIDISGSMSGFPLDLAKDLFRDLIGGLRREDAFNIIVFSGGNNTMSPTPLVATEENVEKGITFLSNQHGGGGTELISALETAVRMPGSADTSRSILVITDGFITMEADAFELVRQELGRANLFAFGIGSSVNRHLIEGLAHVGGGEPFIVTEPADAEPVAKKLRRYISSPVLTNVSVTGSGIELSELEPRSIPDVFASRPLTLTGKWRGAPKGSIRVSGTSGSGETFTQEFDFATATEAGTKNPALRTLWARERVRALADYAELTKDNKIVSEVTSLDLSYSIMTPYTSFVAVDEVVRDFEGAAHPVKQPLPLPHGVSNQAVNQTFTTGGTVPEPGAPLIILAALLTLTLIRNRP